MNGTKPPWWPDWRDQPCVIVAGGLSAQTVGIDQVRGKARVVVINNSWELAPWADMLYASDYDWWFQHKKKLQFGGLLVSQDQRSSIYPDIRLISCDVKKHREMLFDECGVVGYGSAGSGGFQVLNLIAQIGCQPIILTGYDMDPNGPLHWHGKHKGLSNPSKLNFKKWREDIDGVAPVLAGFGIKVLNASPISKLTAYPKMTLTEALAQAHEDQFVKV